jgi:hypothetical protein
VDESEWLRRIEGRLAEGNERARENREALDQNRQFMHELLLRFDKMIERSDRRWQRTLEEHDRRWRATLDRYFGPSGNGTGEGPRPDPA